MGTLTGSDSTEILSHELNKDEDIHKKVFRDEPSRTKSLSLQSVSDIFALSPDVPVTVISPAPEAASASDISLAPAVSSLPLHMSQQDSIHVTNHFRVLEGNPYLKILNLNLNSRFYSYNIPTLLRVFLFKERHKRLKQEPMFTLMELSGMFSMLI